MRRKIYAVYFCLWWFACSCTSEGGQEALVGKWQPVFDQTACLKNMPKAWRSTFDAKPKAQQTAILKEIAEQFERDNWIEFRQDNTFEQSLADGETKRMGKWSIKGGGAQISLQWLKNKDDKNPQRETCQITTLDKQSLILATNSAQVPKLAFVRYKEKKKTINDRNIQKAGIKP